MTELSVADVLERTADLITPEGAWTQGCGARDVRGNRVDMDSGAAVCWCAVFAVSKVAGDGVLAAEARDALRNLLDVPYLSVWNDARGRTQAEVVSAFRKAASLARGSSNV